MRPNLEVRNIQLELLQKIDFQKDF